MDNLRIMATHLADLFDIVCAPSKGRPKGRGRSGGDDQTILPGANQFTNDTNVSTDRKATGSHRLQQWQRRALVLGCNGDLTTFFENFDNTWRLPPS
jgi:hypothetical protein